MLDLTAEHKILKLQYDFLKKEFSELYAEKNDMLTHDEQVLTALYLNAVGQKQHEKYSLTVEIKMMTQRISLYQVYFNRNETPDKPAIEKEIKQQFETYLKKIAEETKRLALAKEFLTEGFLPDAEVKKLKEVYRQIVKRLHPDLHPDQTAEEKDLFISAQAAYDLNDLNALNAILVSLGTSGAGPEALPVDLKAQVELLNKKVQKLKSQMEQLEKQFPFIYREKLADAAWIEAERNQLDAEIETLLAEKKKYKDYLILLEEWKPGLLSS